MIIKALSLLLLLGGLCPSAGAADVKQVCCKEVGEDSEQRVYALIHHKDQWHLLYKSKSHPKWIRLPLLRYEPRITESTLSVDYTSPLGGVRIKWSVREKANSLYVSNSHDLEVNDLEYVDLDDDIDEMNTKTTLKNLSCQIGDLKIKLD